MPRKAKAVPQPETTSPPQQIPALFGVLENALDLLRQSILEKDWEKARSSFRLMTGQELPEGTEPDYKAIVQGVAALISGQASPRVIPVTQPLRQTPVTVPTGGGPLDDEEAEMSRRESARNRNKDYREPFKMRILTCSKCHKERQVHPCLVPVRVDAEDTVSVFVCEFCLVGEGSPT